MDESRIDDLYRSPLAEFTAARGALAKTLSGADAGRVRKLAKPTLVPWVVNQVYWRARPAYDLVLKSGKRLREAQIAAMQGRTADVRGASEAHRRAVAEAVKIAERLAAGSSARPAADALTSMFGAVSLAVTTPEPHGRFTRPLQPVGFEAFAGVKPRARLEPPKKSREEPRAEPREESQEATARKAQTAAREAARRDAALKEAETALEQAQSAEATARRIWERAKRDREAAEQTLASLRQK